MRAIWKGAVSFGLVSVPVKLYSATESHDISFRQVHAKDGGRIKYQRVCSIDGEEVPYAEIAKGYETEDGEMVILDDDDLAELPANSSREISVEKFVPSDQIDPMMFEKSYYLEPEKSGLKPYALLRDALRESDRVAVVTVAIRTRMTPALLRVRDDVLVMQTLMWPDEIRTPDFGSLKDVQDPKPQELEMARLLLDTLAGDYDPDDFEDDYAEAVQTMVQAKLEGGEVKRTKEAAPSAGEVVDLLAALQRSVAAAKKGRGEDDTEEDSDSDASDEQADASEGSPKKSAKSAKSAGKDSKGGKDGKESKKPAAKKTTAKKATKKAAAKKTAAKKSA
jgi:DNA end-binding protein Ku